MFKQLLGPLGWMLLTGVPPQKLVDSLVKLLFVVPL
jgi:hypothetical protein